MRTGVLGVRGLNHGLNFGVWRVANEVVYRVISEWIEGVGRARIFAY